MDDEGYVNIVGRIKDMVIRGGENVYPREIEEFLYTHPDIVDVAGHRRAGREVRRGAVRLGAAARGRHRLTARTLREFCAGKLAHYKIPRYVQFVDEFPMTVTGKIQKSRCARPRSRSSAWTTPRAPRPPEPCAG